AAPAAAGAGAARDALVDLSRRRVAHRRCARSPWLQPRRRQARLVDLGADDDPAAHGRRRLSRIRSRSAGILPRRIDGGGALSQRPPLARTETEGGARARTRVRGAVALG